MNETTNTQTSWLAIAAFGLGLGLVVLGALGGAGCGPDREKLTKEVQDKVRADLDRQIKDEVERRLRSELPRLERRLRAQLTGKKLPPEPAEPGSGPRLAPEPREPGMAPASAPSPDAGVAAPSGPPAVPPDAMEAKAPAEDPQGLVVKRVLLAKKLVERQPEGEGSAFSLADERVYCYVDAKNPKGPERQLTLVWHHNGKVFHKIKLRVGVGHVWRTWGFLRLKPHTVGNWRCGVFNEKDELIAGVPFTVAK